MARVIDPLSAEGKELQKWEQHDSRWNGDVIQAGNPIHLRTAYPMMLYKAQKRDNGKVMCMDAPINPYLFETQAEFDRAALLAEQFNKSCQKTVHSESEMLIAKGQGWCDSPQAALASFEAMEQAIGNAAAEANYQAKRMSDQAQREHQQATNSSHQHVTDVVGTKKRGRPKAVVAIEE